MFLELFDVGVQFFLEIEVVGYGLVGIGICGEGEEVDEELAVSVALVPLQVDVVLDEERGDKDAVQQVNDCN